MKIMVSEKLKKRALGRLLPSHVNDLLYSRFCVFYGCSLLPRGPLLSIEQELKFYF